MTILPGVRRLAVAAATSLTAGAVFGLALVPRPPALAAPHCSAPAVAAEGGYGTVAFANSCAAKVQPALQLEIARLHSFEADTGRFEAIQKADPNCTIALWGAAMSKRGNPLGGFLGEDDLAAGRALIDRAQVLGTGSPREKSLIAAMDVYYRPYPSQMRRARAYGDAMDAVHAGNPGDPDIASLDGLAIIEGVDLSDKTYARQKRAGAILEAVMKSFPGHPGAPHYLIHAYDYATLAPQAVHAAEVYPTIATASPHAQHMPSHIWSMLGAWDKSIRANRRSGAAIDPDAAKSPTGGDIVYDHAFDFIAYARLQLSEDRHVEADLDAHGHGPVIVAARYRLERGDWRGAAALPLPRGGAPFDVALARFTRAYGAARAGETAKAGRELEALRALRPAVVRAEGEYWAVFTDIYAKAAQAWIVAARGTPDEALALMREAAAMDDGHEKHIYLENKIVPMRESLGDMELALDHPAEALADFEASLALAPNRFRAFAGAAKAAAMRGDKVAARNWSQKLVALAGPGDRDRAALRDAKATLASTF